MYNNEDFHHDPYFYSYQYPYWDQVTVPRYTIPGRPPYTIPGGSPYTIPGGSPYTMPGGSSYTIPGTQLNTQSFSMLKQSGVLNPNVTMDQIMSLSQQINALKGPGAVADTAITKNIICKFS